MMNSAPESESYWMSDEKRSSVCVFAVIFRAVYFIGGGGEGDLLFWKKIFF